MKVDLISTSLHKDVAIPVDIVRRIVDGGGNQLTSEHGRDNLVEYAGRVCYDSFGSGRSSEDYHANIFDQDHGSVWDHATFTFETNVTKVFEGDRLTSGKMNPLAIFLVLCSRPGVIVHSFDGLSVRYTMNARAIQEFFVHPQHVVNHGYITPAGFAPVWNLGIAIRALAMSKARMVFSHFRHGTIVDRLFPGQYNSAAYQKAASDLCRDLEEVGGKVATHFGETRLIQPSKTGHVYATMHFREVSRIFTHEKVRHRWDTAMSQESGRYKPTDKNEPVESEAFATIVGRNEELRKSVDRLYASSMVAAEEIESEAMDIAEKEGMPKTDARKFARSAARAVLPTNTRSDIVFTASLPQWSYIFRRRIHPAAENEIYFAERAAADILCEAFPSITSHINGGVVLRGDETI